MRRIQHLEMHVAHACNLSCESCSHYSNHRHRGILRLADAEQWLAAWQPKISPRVFGLLGGEPTLHPQLPDFVRLARRTWPDAHIRIVTNGWFLHRHEDLPAVLASDADASLHVSIHHDSEEYLARFAPVLELLERWKSDHRVNIVVERAYQRWTRRYRETPVGIAPFEDRAPQASWANCAAKYTPQLHEGKLWKCAPLAYLGLQRDQFGLSDKWSHYLTYEALGSECSDAELDAFFARRDESFCGMCPAAPERLTLPLPFAKAAPKPVQVVPARAAPAIPAALRSAAKTLPSPLAGDPVAGIRSYPLLRGPTSILSELECHASVLAPGRSPHPVQPHDAETLLVILEGEAELVIEDPAESALKRLRIGPAALAYCPAGQAHTIFNPGLRPLCYVTLKWRSTGNSAAPHLPALISRHSAELLAQPMFEGPTRYLGKLLGRAGVLRPGAGDPPRTGNHDTAIVLLGGSVSTLDRTLEPVSVVFHAAGEPHALRNPDPSTPAAYFVFEFHPPAST